MPSKSIHTKEEIDEFIEEHLDIHPDADEDALRDMYFTPKEALNAVVKIHQHFGWTFCEIVDIDLDSGKVTLSELFTGEEKTASADEPFDIPFIGETFEVEWIEGKKDGEWERVSNYSTGTGIMEPIVDNGVDIEQYDTFHKVSKEYVHREVNFEKFPIRVDRKTGNPETSVSPDNISNSEMYSKVLNSIQLPENFDLSGLVVGEMYFDQTPSDNGSEWELVWWSIKSQFEESGMYNRLSPVSQLNRSCIHVS